MIKEVLACNCPVVSTDVGDVKWLFGQTDGCYLSSFEVEDMAWATIKPSAAPFSRAFSPIFSRSTSFSTGREYGRRWGCLLSCSIPIFHLLSQPTFFPAFHVWSAFRYIQFDNFSCLSQVHGSFEWIILSCYICYPTNFASVKRATYSSTSRSACDSGTL